MATLKKHGREVGRWDYATATVALMEDGHVLKNAGNGWKLYRKLKPGIAPEDAAARRNASYKARMDACPSLAAYTKLLRRAVGLKNAWKVETAIDMMPGDPDGVWSTVNEWEHVIDLDDAVDLCRLYVSAQAERKEYLEDNKP